jgi:hypothetical protein
MTVAMDDNIGKVIGKVRESGLENDTQRPAERIEMHPL